MATRLPQGCHKVATRLLGDIRMLLARCRNDIVTLPDKVAGTLRPVHKGALLGRCMSTYQQLNDYVEATSSQRATVCWVYSRKSQEVRQTEDSDSDTPEND